MKTMKSIGLAGLLLSFSIVVFASPSNTAQVNVDKTIVHHTPSDIEAGSNMAPGAQSTGRGMDDAFDVHTLVAGEWN